MIDLNSLKPKVEVSEFGQKKILCIIEGDLEFRYISKIFKLYGYEKGCYALSEEKIKIAWGMPKSKKENIVSLKCLFQGGSRKGANVPFPAIQSFEIFARDLSVFNSVLVFFDGDKDKNNEVEEYFIEAFKGINISNTLLVSIPCFESTLIDFCTCEKCRIHINNIEDEKYPCDKYKNNFSKLECFKGDKHLVANLTIKQIDTLKEKTSKLNSVNVIIQDFMEKISI